MPIFSETFVVLIILSIIIIISIYATKTKVGKYLGTALLIIFFTALVANFKIIPSASNSIELYSIIFEYIAPISIFYLLLNASLNSIKKAGLPMILTFLIGSIGTAIGIMFSWLIVSPQNILGEEAKIIAGMLTGTYTGGSVNFNAIAMQYDFQKNGILYAGTIAVDNVVTALWILATLMFPILFSKIWKSNIKINNNLLPNESIDNEKMNLISLSWLIFLGMAAHYFSELIAFYLPKIPSILILSTFGIGLAQTKFVKKLNGSHNLGLYMVYLFLAVIGAYCEFDAVYQLKDIGVVLLLFTSVAVLFHGLVIVFFCRFFYRDWHMIAIASQANVGGSASAIALAETFDRKDLILPSILVGTLGNAIGTYLGFFVIYIL